MRCDIFVVVVCVGMERGTVGQERDMGEGRGNKEVSLTLLSETSHLHHCRSFCPHCPLLPLCFL